MFFLDISGIGDSASLESAEGIGAIVTKAARSLFYLFNEMIYNLICFLYNLFEVLCNARLLDSEALLAISTKVGLILGIIMLFRVVLSFVKILLEPDKFNDKETGAVSIIKKVVIVIVMLGSSSFVFNFMYDVQKFIIHEKILYKLFLPTDDVNLNTEQFGNVLSARVFSTFYTVKENLIDSSNADAEQCVSYRNLLINKIITDHDFQMGRQCLTAYTEASYEASDSSDADSTTTTSTSSTTFNTFIMDYHFLYQSIVGIAFVYLLFMYSIKVGVRVIQLTILEIISPMAVVSYLSPKKDNMFSKWFKIYISTYIDIFIRVGIIYFCVFLSAQLLDTIESGETIFWTSVGQEDKTTRAYIVVIMILALLTFAKKAPELLKELLPTSASKLGFGLSSPKSFIKDLKESPLTKTLKPLAAPPIGLLKLGTKKTFAGLDSALAGQGFGIGWRSQKSKFGGWIEKQTPFQSEARNNANKQRAEGIRELQEINKKWNSGVEIVKKLMNSGGFNKYSDSDPNAWNKAFNGISKKGYQTVFKNQSFISSKMNLDRESSVEDDLRRGMQQINAGGSYTYDGTTYSSTNNNIDQFVKLYEGQQKKVEGIKAVHDSIRKQYVDDARTEDYFKFIKSNEYNPTKPAVSRRTKGI